MGQALNQLIAQQQGPNILGAVGNAINTAGALEQLKAIPIQQQLEQQRLSLGQRQLANMDAQMAKQHQEESLQFSANLGLQIAQEKDPAKKAQIFQQGRQLAEQQGLDVSKWPAEYNAQTQQGLDNIVAHVYGPEQFKANEQIRVKNAEVEAANKMPMSAKEQVKFQEEQRHNRATEGIQQQGVDLKKQEANPFGANAGAAGNPAGPHGEEYLSTLPGNIAAQVKALSEGRMAFPGGFALKSPYWQQMISAVSQYDPSFDAVNYNARSKTRNDFTAGKSATSINALNTVIGHLQTLSDAADGLNNSSLPAYNKVANFLTSNTGDPRVKVFNTAKKAVVDELTRAYRGTGGSESDIKSWAENIDAANSPEQLHSVIAQMGHLLESKVTALGEQYNQGMGTTNQPIQLVTPHARQVLTKLEQRTGNEKTTQNGPQTITNDADYNALPSGAEFIAPDGSHRRKP